MSHHLYRHFDVDGSLLYVGISACAWTRLARGHRRCASWFQSIARVEITTFDSRKSAHAAEKLAIRDERPKFNRSGSLDYVYRGKARGRPRLYGRRVLLSLTDGTLSDIDAVVGEDETRLDLIRAAIERELTRRIRVRS